MGRNERGKYKACLVFIHKALVSTFMCEQRLRTTFYELSRRVGVGASDVDFQLTRKPKVVQRSKCHS